MNNAELLSKEIEELEKELQENEENLEELEHDLDNIEYNIDYTKEHIEYLNEQIERKRMQFLNLSTPEEQEPYWLSLLTDTSRKGLEGQIEYNNKWYVCNGYVLLESNTKFDSLVQSYYENVDNLVKVLNQEITPITFDIENIENMELNPALPNHNAITVADDCNISLDYLLPVKNVLQLKNEDKFYVNDAEKGKSLFVENEKGRAIILGIRHF